MRVIPFSPYRFAHDCGLDVASGAGRTGKKTQWPRLTVYVQTLSAKDKSGAMGGEGAVDS